MEIVTIGDHEFEEVIEEYEEEILVQEEVLDPPLTDWADTAPAQGKPLKASRPLVGFRWLMTIQDYYD